MANGARVGSSGACECQRVLVFAQVRRSTWGCRTAQRSMVRRRSTVRFRKGDPSSKPFIESHTESICSFCDADSGRVGANWLAGRRAPAVRVADAACGSGQHSPTARLSRAGQRAEDPESQQSADAATQRDTQCKSPRCSRATITPNICVSPRAGAIAAWSADHLVRGGPQCGRAESCGYSPRVAPAGCDSRSRVLLRSPGS